MGAVVSLGHTTPPKVNNLYNEDYEPKEIIDDYFTKMQTFIKNNKNLKFCSFTVPPEMKINKNKKMVAYGNQHI
uniref:hypothetical protein n=1 Tax=Yoonia sp. TaxID=2212373 RepID=UPI0040477E3F